MKITGHSSVRFLNTIYIEGQEVQTTPITDYEREKIGEVINSLDALNKALRDAYEQGICFDTYIERWQGIGKKGECLDITLVGKTPVVCKDGKTIGWLDE